VQLRDVTQGPKYSPPAELNNLLRDPLTTEAEEVVVLAKVLADDLNFGYQDMGGIQLSKVNGKEVESMTHLKELLEDATKHEKFYEFELKNSQLLVLDIAACAQLEKSILDSYGLSQPRSLDLSD
jgi:hypothetical protein